MFRLLFFCFFLFNNLSGQNKIDFVELSLQQALDKANAENKMIFIDAYASYCLPCKQMDVAFQNPLLLQYFNDNFINIKVNVENEISEAYKLNYQIVFLPTLIFIDASGKQRTKIDNVVTANELLSIGKFINNKYGNDKTLVHETTSQNAPVINPTPFGDFPISETQNISTLPQKKSVQEEKILYVIGQDEKDLPPHLLKQEAYFRMQLMDGSHYKSAKKYLDTQENWQTEDSVRFIFDFVPDCHSPLFQHVIDHKALYDLTLGKEQVDKTIGILVKRELERGYPRPNKERALFLYRVLNRSNAPILAEQYVLETQFLKKEYQVFFTKGLQFIENQKPHDSNFTFMICQAALALNTNKKDLKKSIKLMDGLVARNPNNENYYYVLAKLHNKANDKKKATYNIQKAVNLLKVKNFSDDKITNLYRLLTAS